MLKSEFAWRVKDAWRHAGRQTSKATRGEKRRPVIVSWISHVARLPSEVLKYICVACIQRDPRTPCITHMLHDQGWSCKLPLLLVWSQQWFDSLNVWLAATCNLVKWNRPHWLTLPFICLSPGRISMESWSWQPLRPFNASFATHESTCPFDLQLKWKLLLAAKQPIIISIDTYCMLNFVSLASWILTPCKFVDDSWWNHRRLALHEDKWQPLILPFLEGEKSGTWEACLISRRRRRLIEIRWIQIVSGFRVLVHSDMEQVAVLISSWSPFIWPACEWGYLSKR